MGFEFITKLNQLIGLWLVFDRRFRVIKIWSLISTDLMGRRVEVDFG